MSAPDKLHGYDWVLQISRAATPTTFVTVACLETNDMENSNSPIDTTSKCDNGGTSAIPGPKGWSMKASGFSVDDRGQTSMASYLTLQKVFNLSEIVGVRFARKNNGASDYYYYGKAFILTLNQTADVKDSVKFDLELQGVGNLGIGGSY